MLISAWVALDCPNNALICFYVCPSVTAFPPAYRVGGSGQRCGGCRGGGENNHTKQAEHARRKSRDIKKQALVGKCPLMHVW